MVEERYKGRDLIIELWDVADIVGGVNNIPDKRVVFRIESESGPCSIHASREKYNDELITITTKILDNYTCTGDGSGGRSCTRSPAR